MRVYYCDDSGAIDRLLGHEGVTTLESMPVGCRASNLSGDRIPICERIIGLVRIGVCPYHSMFCHFFSINLYEIILL